MNEKGFPSYDEGTEEKKLNIASIPTLSQLKLLLEEEMAEENRVVEPDPPVEFASDRFPNGIPSASQLRFLQSQEKKPHAAEPELAGKEESRAPVQSAPKRVTPVKKADARKGGMIVNVRQALRKRSNAEKPGAVRAAAPKAEKPQAKKEEPAAAEEPRNEAEEKLFASLSSMKKILDEFAAAQKAIGDPGERTAQAAFAAAEEPEEVIEEPVPEEDINDFIVVPFGKDKDGFNDARFNNTYLKTDEDIDFDDFQNIGFDLEAEENAALQNAEQEKAEEVQRRFTEPEEKPFKKKQKNKSKKRRRARSKKRRELNVDPFTGSIIDSLPTTEQIENSKPRHGRSSDVDDQQVPSEKQLIHERRRLNYKGDFFRVIRNTIFTLITVSAVAVLVAVLLLPVLRIYGASMTPALNEGEIVLSVKGGDFTTGDVVAFYYNNKILVKRVIAEAGDWVNIDKEGTVSINGEIIDEPYVQKKAFGECDIELPYQVPEDRVFVMGDYRDVSIDSRSSTIGPIAKDQVVGKIIYRIWPFKTVGSVG